MRTAGLTHFPAVENALAAEAEEVFLLLAMHGRTREQMYTGHADFGRLFHMSVPLSDKRIYRHVHSHSFNS